MQWASVLAMGVGLSACADTAELLPPAGDLLNAPTQLNFSGQVVTLEAAPRVVGAVFQVGVRVLPGRSELPLPKLNVRDVYVVTGGGVWNAPYRPASCSGCLSGAGVGRSAGINTGETVQVVLRVIDRQGRQFWLRDARAKVTAP